MMPPGRRRHLPFSIMLPLLVLVLFSTCASAASAVLGVDLGTEYFKAALVKPGIPLEIVLTKDSKRKEAATITFKPSRQKITDPEAFPERLYGGDAVALAARFPGDVYPNLKTLLGLNEGSEIVRDYQQRYPGLTLEKMLRGEPGSEEGTVAFRSQSFGKEQEPFMVEELLAMELKNIKANAEAAAGPGSLVTDVVITFPPFYTAEEKRAVELAADLAGLRVLGLMSDGLAVGLNYATSRTFASVSDGADPEYHLVYDMGAGSTSATVLKFQGRTIKDVGKRNKTIQEVQVLGTAWDRTLGGDALNQLIVTDMIDQFVETRKIKDMGVMPIHVKSHGKSMARLWKDAERIRQVLSANSQTSASFEGLFYDDANFKYPLSRTHFEKLVSEHAARVTAPLTDALDFAGLKLEDLESIILHGGAVRTPFVQKQLEALSGASNKIKTNVNADEAAVLGAAFKAAGISPSFRVKDIRASDTPGFAIDLKWTVDGKEKQQKLFTSTSQIGAEKQVPLKTLEDFKLQFLQLVGENPVPISEVEATNLTASVAQLKDKYGCLAANISTKFNIRLSPLDGLPELLSGTVSCELESSKEGSVIDNVKGLFGFGSKKSTEQEPMLADEATVEDSSETTTSATASSSSSTSSTSSATSQTSKSSTSKPTAISIPISLTTTPMGLNKPPASSLNRIRTRLSLFDDSDRSRMLRSEALNTLEAYTYRARDYLSDESFLAVSTKSALQILESKLDAASEWLYGDGTDAKLKDFKDKLKELQGLVDPVLSRRSEIAGRDEAVRGLREALGSMKAMIQMVEGSVEKAAEDAAAAASRIVAETEASSSSFTESPTSTAEMPELDADDLDNDPYSSSGSMTASSSAPSKSDSSPPLPLSPYTVEDIPPLLQIYDTVSAWLEEKLTLQGKLTTYDDPAILIADLELRAKQLQTEASNVIMKNIRMPSSSSSSKKAKATSTASSKKEKKTKTPKKSKSKNGSSSTSTTAASSETSATTTAKRRDEL